MYREEGFVGFFRGNGTNILRMVPYTAIQFAVYERAKEVGVVLAMTVGLHKLKRLPPVAAPRSFSTFLSVEGPSLLKRIAL